MKIKRILMMIFLSIFLASCSSSLENLSKCPDAAIDYADVLMMNGIIYQHHSPEIEDENKQIKVEKGQKIGEVRYKLANHACSSYKMKNGDSTFMDIGTPIYIVKGYPSSFLVLADNQVYVSEQNKNAKTANELYPLKEFAKKIYIESTEDGRRLHTFSSSSTKEFTEAWDDLKIKNVDYKDEELIFLEIELKNGVSYRLSYAKNSNVFLIGVKGNEKIKTIIQKEQKKMEK
ncbi:hypothetical protein ACWV26_08275 [Rummeliibacillus sp. JY-2-4R]